MNEEDENLDVGNDDEADEEDEEEENESGDENVAGNTTDYTEAHGGSNGPRRRQRQQLDSSNSRSTFLTCPNLHRFRPLTCCSRRKRSDTESDETISSSPPNRQASL